MRWYHEYRASAASECNPKIEVEVEKESSRVVSTRSWSASTARAALYENRVLPQPSSTFRARSSRGLDPRLLSLSLAGQGRNTPPEASQEIVEARRLKAADGESGSVGVSFQISLVLAAAPGSSTSVQAESEALQSRTDRAAAASSHALIIR